MNGEAGIGDEKAPGSGGARLSTVLSVGEDLQLSLLEMSDAEELFCVLERNREHLGAWLPWVDDVSSIRDERRYILDSLESFEQDQSASYAIRYRGSIAGGLGFVKVDWVNRGCIVGYWLAEGYTGRGIITRCCRALFDSCFNDLRLHRIALEAAVDNEKSRAVAERLGMRLEGIAKETKRLRGRYCDSVLYGITCPEWKEQLGEN